MAKMRVRATSDFWPPESCCSSFVSEAMPVNDTCSKRALQMKYTSGSTPHRMVNLPLWRLQWTVRLLKSLCCCHLAWHCLHPLSQMLAVRTFTHVRSQQDWPLVSEITYNFFSSFHDKLPLSTGNQFLKDITEVFGYLPKKTTISGTNLQVSILTQWVI